MPAEKTLEQRILDGDITIAEFCLAKVEGTMEKIRQSNPDMLWTISIQKHNWESVINAHRDGKKIVAFGGSMPVELFAAFDLVPFYLDMIPFKLCSYPKVVSKFIDESEKYISASTCGLDKTELGGILCGAYGFEPDIFVYSSVPCDSSRLAYPAMEQLMGLPTFSFDTPFRRDARGIDYLADQVEDLVAFLEEVTGKKLDWDALKYRMELSNKIFTMQKKLSELRKHKPCPLPSSVLILNGMTNAVPCYQELLDVFETEYEMAQMLAELGMGACPEEKYRVAVLQNMIWGHTRIMDWMEKTYNAVCIMDAFGFQGDELYQDLEDRRHCWRVMAQRMQNNPMIHGASGPSERHLELADKIFAEYDANVSMFFGHIGCKHTWASAKMVTDMVQSKYGLPTLLLDVDCIDGRYKSPEEIKAQIADYFETVVMRQ